MRRTFNVQATAGPDALLSRRLPILGALIATLAVSLQPIGNLVVRFGIDEGVAATVVGLVASGAGWTISVFFPWVIPFIATIQGLIVAFGVGVAIGW